MQISTNRLSPPSQFDHFGTNVDYVSRELVKLRRELDQFENQITPTDTFNPTLRTSARPSITIASIALFSLCTLCFNAHPTRLLLCAIIVLAIYESVTISLSFRTTAYTSPLSGASIGTIGLTALVGIVAIPAHDLLLVYLLVTGAGLFGTIIDRRCPCQPLPHPFPNLCLHQTAFGLLGTILLPAILVPGLIRLQFLSPHYYPLATIGFATIIANLGIAAFKRSYGVCTSSEISVSQHPLLRFLNHITGGLLDHFAPLIFTCALLLVIGFVP